MNFRTYEDLVNCIHKNIGKIPCDIDLVVGIPRSGTMVANIIALSLNLPFMDIEDFLNNRVIVTGTTRKSQNWIPSVEHARHILVVDDSVSSGKAVREVKERLRGRKEKYTYLAVYALAVSCKMVDIFFEICEQPRMFEWNYMHHWMLEYACIDSRGIIYEREVEKGIKVRVIPTQKIGCLILPEKEQIKNTCDIDSKEYLEYDILYKGDYSIEKIAEFYKHSKYVIFFEADYDMACSICNISGKPVFCTSERKLIQSSDTISRIINKSMERKITINRVIKKILGKINYIK